MTTFTFPLNVRLKNEPTSTNDTVVIPGVIRYPFSNSQFASAATGVSAKVSLGTIPAGFVVYDAVAYASSVLTGTSGATMNITLGDNLVGPNSSLNTTFITRAAGSCKDFGTVLAADTGVGLHIQTSAAASVGEISGGGGVLVITVGVPYDASTRA